MTPGVPLANAVGVTQLGQKDDPLILGKRGADDSSTSHTITGEEVVDMIVGALVPLGIIADRVAKFEGPDPPNISNGGTPQKNANKKKLKGVEGDAADSAAVTKTLEISASSHVEDGRKQ